MVKDGKPDLCFAFVKGESKGTKDCVRKCRKAGVWTTLITEDSGEIRWRKPWEQLNIEQEVGRG